MLGMDQMLLHLADDGQQLVTVFLKIFIVFHGGFNLCRCGVIRRNEHGRVVFGGLSRTCGGELSAPQAPWRHSWGVGVRGQKGALMFGVDRRFLWLANDGQQFVTVFLRISTGDPNLCRSRGLR